MLCFGLSLGGAVAFHLAEYAQQYKLPLAGLLVENTFLSIKDGVSVDALDSFEVPHLEDSLEFRSDCTCQ